jgi:hypothetical protein
MRIGREKREYRPIIKTERDVFLVQSERDLDKFYEVQLIVNSCTCPAKQYSGLECKHIIAAKDFAVRSIDKTGNAIGVKV